MKKISQSTWIPLLDLDEGTVEKGNDLYTTINVGMQDIVHHALLESCEKFEAAEGTAVVMEVETGAIKAISNFTQDEKGGYSERYNHAVGKSTEPGSTFKLASVLALLDDGLADLDTKVNLNGGRKRFYNLTMSDSKIHGIQSSTLREAFEISSNVGVATLCQSRYGETQKAGAFVKKLRQFGLFDKTGIEISGEGDPYIKDPVKDKKLWYGTTIPWMAHGYELQLTPLQLLTFFNAIANDGRKMKPYLVSEIRGEYGVIKKFEPKVEKASIASSASITKAQNLLKGVVMRGTAKNLRSDIVTMAGKTGTTAVGYAAKDGSKAYNASFAGYFPAENPKYSVIVVIYKPKGAYYGSSVAAPVFKKIAEHYTLIDLDLQEAMKKPEDILVKRVPNKGVGYKEDFQTIMEHVHLEYKDRSKSKWVEVDPYESKMLIDNKRIKIAEVPDVRGMGARDAAYVLENIGMQVVMEGVGKVYKQSLLPGTKNNGQPIKIFLD
jgi:cell division protein FtsI (penicillin-binding protein 3)